MADIDLALDAISEVLKRKKVMLADNISWQRRPRAGGFVALELVAPIAMDGGHPRWLAGENFLPF